MQKGLRPSLSNVWVPPRFEWVEWLSSEAQQALDDYEEYKRIDREMRQSPIHPAKVK
jgi:hypothetical protein